MPVSPSRCQLITLFVGCAAVVSLVPLLSHIQPVELLQGLATAAEEAKAAYPLTTAACALGFYLLWSLCFIPTTPVELVMGYLFGFQQAYCITYAGKLIGAALCFALVRGALHGWAMRTFGQHELLRMLEEEAATRPFAAAFTFRAAYVPLPLKNYGMPLFFSALPLFVATCIVEIADSYMLVAIGSTAKSIADALAGGGSESQGQLWFELTLTALEVALLVALICFIAVLAKRSLDRRRADKAGAVLV